jgi:hypothetical protein
MLSILVDVSPGVARFCHLVVKTCWWHRRIASNKRAARPAGLIEYLIDFTNFQRIPGAKRHGG